MTNLIEVVGDWSVVYRLGWTLIHTLWLGAAIAAAFALSLLVLRRRSANVRYVAGCLAMLAMLAAPAATFLTTHPPAPLSVVLASDDRPLPAAIAESPALLPAIDVAVRPQAGAPQEAPLKAQPVASPLAAAVEPPATPTWPMRAAAAAACLEPALPWVVLAWVVGVMMLSIWQLGGWIAASRLKRLATRPGEPALVETLARLAGRLRVWQPVRLLESALVRVPMVLGWLRPVILLPLGLAAGLAPQQVEAILAHELAHIRRCDYLINLLQTLVETLLFYHPAVWFISRRIRIERENRCDDIAVAAGAERFSYAESLLEVARQSVSRPRLLPASGAPGLGATGKASDLRARIVRLLADPSEADARLGRSWPVATTFLAAIALVAAAMMTLPGKPASATQGVEAPLASPVPDATAGPEGEDSSANSASQPASGAQALLPLARVKPQAKAAPTQDQLNAAFHFDHEPVDKAGFNHLTLPFHFSSKDDAGDEAEAGAFTFLLSHSIDWSPGCWCARHAIFVFANDKAVTRLAKEDYTTEAVAAAMSKWHSTHAIGGEIQASKGGYSGKMVIYDANANIVLEKEYAKDREFFTLLGDMSVDAIKFLGDPPSDELVKFLHRKRCENPQSLIKLGIAVFLPGRSEEQFGLFKTILEREPNFADLRYWWANQQHWCDGDDESYYKQVAQALDACPVPVFREVPLDLLDVAASPAQCQRWMDAFRKIVGDDYPTALRSELLQAMRSDANRLPQLAPRVRSVAARFSNSYWLLLDGGRAMLEQPCIADGDAAGGMYLLASQSKLETGDGDRSGEKLGLAAALQDIGRSDWAAGYSLSQVPQLSTRGNERAGAMYCQAGEALMQVARYSEAVDAFSKALRLGGGNESVCKRVFVEGGTAMALSGQRDRLATLIDNHDADGKKYNCLATWQAYLDLLDGKKIDAAAIWKSFTRKDLADLRTQTLLYAQACYVNNDQSALNDLLFLVRWDPEYRPAWYLFDAYDRRWPQATSASFYETLEWLHGDDAWVKQAASDFRTRMPKPRYKDLDALRQELQPFEAVRWPAWKPGSLNARAAMILMNQMPPGTVAAHVRRLLDRKEYALAGELALRFHSALAGCSPTPGAPMQANHLIELVQRAQPPRH